MSERQRIVIVGAGVSGLATAFALTDPQSNPGWEDRYTVDVYQMGWRVGGKCATGRDPQRHERILEHGIHVFGNMYFNAMRMASAAYDEVIWDDHDRHRSMEEAFLPSVVTLNTEWMNGQWHNYLGRFPLSDGNPWTGPHVWPDLQQLVQGCLSMINQDLADALEGPIDPNDGWWDRMKGAFTHWLGDVLEDIVEDIAERLVDDERDPDDPEGEHDIVIRLMTKLVQLMEHHVREHPEKIGLRQKFTQIDLVATAVRGMLNDDVIANGIDCIDGENYHQWFQRHGMSQITLHSGLPQGYPNTALSYERGDTTAIPTMSAAAWLTFFLRQVAGKGAGAYFFKEGTGETIMKPLFRLLEQRGVTFHFFHKLAEVTPAADRPVIQTLRFDVQATVKGDRYEPLRRTADLELVWPDRPNYDQLEEGDELREQGIDLESWWTPWTPVAQRELVHGVDFDHVVLATPIATLPHTCAAVIEHPAADDAWKNMVGHVKTAATQAVQIWLNTPTSALGWNDEMELPTDRYVGGFFGQDLTSFCDFSDLVAEERWPLDNRPQGLVYFIGALADPEEPVPFTDHDHPRREDERVKWSTIQFLRSIDGLMPGATNVENNPTDARSFDFGLLVSPEPATRGTGVNIFDQQYWRANIDPNERYTLTVAGSVQHRLKAWDSRFDNLVLAGDWIYTGFNIGSFEGAVMSGKLASLTLTGAPQLDEIYGYDFLHPDTAQPPAPLIGT
ncbi:MAG: NAD(P)-binding protein [Actinobacteria bacterium]|nr:NAD(P)-binding protein [Actinomycetota bacterium]